MRPLPSAPRLLGALLVLLAVTTGCVRSLLTNGQIAATREASGAFNTLGDYELARSAVQAGLAQFEGMHALAPENEDALFLLLKGWSGYGFGFPQDDWDDAVTRGDDESAEYHRERATLAFERAVGYGLELLSRVDAGFAAARKDDASIKRWLAAHFARTGDAPILFWTGYAWLARVAVNRDRPEIVADLYVGVAMLEQAVRLDPAQQHWSGVAALAAYHARPAGEHDQSRLMFEMVLERTRRSNFLVLVTYAQTYACMKGDRALYEKLAREVLGGTGDVDPDQRLPNAIARRRAKRLLDRRRMLDCGFDMSAPPAT